MRHSRGQETLSIVDQWLGHYVVVRYIGGPGLEVERDEKGIRRGETEARASVFHLQKYGTIGIEVAKTPEEGRAGRVTLIPWSAVLSLRGTTEKESRIDRAEISRTINEGDPT